MEERLTIPNASANLVAMRAAPRSILELWDRSTPDGELEMLLRLHSVDGELRFEGKMDEAAKQLFQRVVALYEPALAAATAVVHAADSGERLMEEIKRLREVLQG